MPSNTPHKFGVLYAPTNNLGDSIQTLAQIEVLKKMHITNPAFINRETLSKYNGEPINLLMGGWYAHDINCFPPSKKINPIFISVHINSESFVSQHQNYFKQHEPIGCRDAHTKELMEKYHIKAYLSKCLSLMFDEYRGKREGVYNVDIFTRKAPRYKGHTRIRKLITKLYRVPILNNYFSKRMYEYDISVGNAKPELLTNETFINSLPRQDTTHITHTGATTDLQSNLQRAQRLLDIYRQAALVITSRMHCTLPCRAMGTPVIFVHEKYKRGRRFRGLHQELNGSDGSIPFNQLDANIDNKTIASAKGEILKDIRQRLKSIL